MEAKIERILKGLGYITKQIEQLEKKNQEWPTQSESIAKLHTDLYAAQMNMPALLKNSQGYNFEYVDLPGIIEHVKPILGRYYLCFTQEATEINDKLYIITVIRHMSGEWIRSKTPVYLPLRSECTKDYNQECGKAISYMRRYALESILGLKGDKDDYDRRQKEKK